LGVRYVVDGLVRSDGTNLSVRVHLDDTRAHTTLWSRQLSAPIKDLDALQARVAVHTAGVTRTVVASTADVVRDQPDVLSTYLAATDDLSVPLSEQVVARAPNFSAGHALLALALWASAQNLSEAAESAAVSRIRKEAKIALSLVPTDNIAYAIL